MALNNSINQIKAFLRQSAERELQKLAQTTLVDPRARGSRPKPKPKAKTTPTTQAFARLLAQQPAFAPSRSPSQSASLRQLRRPAPRPQPQLISPVPADQTAFPARMASPTPVPLPPPVRPRQPAPQASTPASRGVPAGREQAEQLIARALAKEGILTPETLKYAMATVQHETAGTFAPIEEYGGRQQARKLGYGGGENYFGRGYIQLTHDYNYRDIGKRIGLGDKLVKNPQLALDPEVAARILAAFFKDRGVVRYTSRGDFINARRPVNGLDQAERIAAYARAYTPTKQYGRGG